jgi:Rrf2 family iron-sulfur cluster assembly transcriptional regulator
MPETTAQGHSFPMLLSQTAEYALRAMTFLASLPPDAARRSADIATGTGIPGTYLAKVLTRLVREGLLSARKGHGGGFRLARAPADITFAQVLAAAEPDPVGDRCAFGWGQCDAVSPCLLHPAWSDLKARFRAWAETNTLATVNPPAAPALA